MSQIRQNFHANQYLLPSLRKQQGRTGIFSSCYWKFSCLEETLSPCLLTSSSWLNLGNKTNYQKVIGNKLIPQTKESCGLQTVSSYYFQLLKGIVLLLSSQVFSSYLFVSACDRDNTKKEQQKNIFISKSGRYNFAFEPSM